ncbi:hypothetical protein AAVH_39163 [Aphelenchoides avenae]|nr:hypothetical protein AAVH_39163 [Aphelenchus avenae]
MHANADRSRRYLTYTDTYPASAITNPSPYNYSDRRRGYHPQQDVEYCTIVGCCFLSMAILFIGIGLLSAVSNGNILHSNALHGFGFGVPLMCLGVCFSACAVHTQNKIRRGQIPANTNGTYYVADRQRAWPGRQYTVATANSTGQVQWKQLPANTESTSLQAAGGTSSPLPAAFIAEQENILNTVLESTASNANVTLPPPQPLLPPPYEAVAGSVSNNLNCFASSTVAGSTRTLTFAVPVLPPPPEYSRAASAKRSSSLP